MCNTETILDIILTVEFSIFGIAVTIFTVLYSFIVNRKETLAIHTNSKIEQTKSTNPILDKRIIYVHTYINRIKRFNNHLLILGFSSFFLGICSIVFIVLNDIVPNLLMLILGLFAVLSLVYVFVLFISVVKHYFVEIKI